MPASPGPLTFPWPVPLLLNQCSTLSPKMLLYTVFQMACSIHAKIPWASLIPWASPNKSSTLSPRMLLYTVSQNARTSALQNAQTYALHCLLNCQLYSCQYPLGLSHSQGEGGVPCNQCSDLHCFPNAPTCLTVVYCTYHRVWF